MSDPAARPADTGARGTDARDAADDLDTLRAILVGPEQQALATLRARLDDPVAQARSVGAVLPQALHLRARDADLAKALTPPIEQAITASVQRNPKPLADALFPVMGPAIRRAVAASLAAMVESFNRTLEQSVSWRSLRWRVEAMRTGRSFGEVVLLHTLLYRVEQVFLIERPGGLLLQHVRAGDVGVQDADMVSGMLTAIRDFVGDSFRVSDQASLDAFQVGDLAVWIEQGPRAIIAAVIRGTPPAALRRALQDALETIHLQQADAFDAFDGDAGPFEAARPALEGCLQTAYRSDARPRGRAAAVFAVALLAVLVVWLGLVWRERQRWNAYLDTLRAQPGLVVVSSGRAGGRFVVTGLRDPHAPDPGELLRTTALDPSEVVGAWRPYQALDPPIVLARARAVLQPPPSASLAFDRGVLAVSGRAPAAWLAAARARAPLVAGVDRFDAAPAIDAEMRDIIDRIQATVPLFAKGTSRLVPGQEPLVEQLAADLRQLEALAAAGDRQVRVTVTGHTDADGAVESNVPLSRARAERVRDAVAPGLSGRLDFAVTGAGSSQPAVEAETEPGKQRNRRVTLRVDVTSAAGIKDARP